MVAAEFKTAESTVRIHDEYCEMTVDHCISDLSRIISASYKRRQLLNREGKDSAAIAATNITAVIRES